MRLTKRQKNEALRLADTFFGRELERAKRAGVKNSPALKEFMETVARGLRELEDCNGHLFWTPRGRRDGRTRDARE